MVDRVDDVLIRRYPTSQPEWLNELSDVMDDDAEILDSRNDEHSPDRGRERESTTSCFGCKQAPNTEHTLSTGQKWLMNKPTRGIEVHLASPLGSRGSQRQSLEGACDEEWLWAGTQRQCTRKEKTNLNQKLKNTIPKHIHICK